jgi:hypothetical protein
MDECKTWADKAEALASYAGHANNNTLRQLADRIQARAIRREGELLQEIAAATPGPKAKNSGRAPIPNSGRFAAAENAGLSRHQAKTAIRVANIPGDVFEGLVESEDPPTVTELADFGTARKPKPLVELNARTPRQFQAATGLTPIPTKRRY